MKYKIGDRVRITKDICSVFGCHFSPAGTQGIVRGVNNITSLYTVELNNGYCNCSESLLEPDKSYEDGLAEGRKEGWELANRIGSLEGDERVKIFDNSDAFHFGWLLDNYTPEEALAKIEKYEQKKTIIPRDIVEYNGKKWIVTEAYKEEYTLWNGETTVRTGNAKKVGHADSLNNLAELLQ